MYFNAAQIRHVLTYAELIPEMRRALIEYSAGRVVQPLRTMMRARPHGRYGVMSAVYGRVMGTKMVSIYPENGASGLPSHASVIQLFDADTGLALATFDGDLITEMRTAAVAALAAQVLAPENTRTLSILGAGVQARAHLEALRHLRSFDRVSVWSRSRDSAEAFASQASADVAESVVEAVSLADVVVVATGATKPIVAGHAMKAANLVIAVGAVHPTARELDDAVMQGTLVVESREAAQAESGDVILSGAAIYGELGQLLGGQIPLPSTPRNVFKSVGIAVEDVAAAHLVYRRLSPGAR